jgi:fatty acyl-CoA reductase
LGLDQKDIEDITANVNVIINCAASVDFNSRLDEAIKINVFGTLKMFELAKKSKNLESFLHVSTAYVNSDKKGVIEEKIYDIGMDAEEHINELFKRPVDEVINFAI